MVNACIADSGGRLVTSGFYFIISGIKLCSDTVDKDWLIKS